MTGLGQDAGDQAGGRGLAVRTGDGDALPKPHQLGQHQRTRHDGNTAAARRRDFGIVLADRGGNDHHIGRAQIVGRMPLAYARAKLRQMPRRMIVGQVRAANAESQIEQHLGDAAHAGTANTDEMHVLDLMLHRIRSAG